MRDSNKTPQTWGDILFAGAMILVATSVWWLFAWFFGSHYAALHAHFAALHAAR